MNTNNINNTNSLDENNNSITIAPSPTNVDNPENIISTLSHMNENIMTKNVENIIANEIENITNKES